MPTVTLTPNGATVNAGLDANVSIVGGSPQWGDGSDSTYSVGDSNITGTRADMSAPLPALVLPAGATVTAIRATIRAACTGTTALLLLSTGPSDSDEYCCYFTNDLAHLTDNGTYGLTTSPANYDVVQATGAGTGADPLTTLLAGAYVEASTSGLEALTVYEFTVYVDYTLSPAPVSSPFAAAPDHLRVWPRSNASAERTWPPPRSNAVGNLTGYL